MSSSQKYIYVYVYGNDKGIIDINTFSSIGLVKSFLSQENKSEMKKELLEMITSSTEMESFDFDNDKYYMRIDKTVLNDTQECSLNL